MPPPYYLPPPNCCVVVVTRLNLIHTQRKTFYPVTKFIDLIPNSLFRVKFKVHKHYPTLAGLESLEAEICALNST